MDVSAALSCALLVAYARRCAGPSSQSVSVRGETQMYTSDSSTMLRPRRPHGHYVECRQLLGRLLHTIARHHGILAYSDMQRAGYCLFNSNRQLKKVQGLSLELDIRQGQPRRLRKRCMTRLEAWCLCDGLGLLVLRSLPLRMLARRFSLFMSRK